MDVSLTPDLEQRIHQKVESGRYPSASEVVREALRLLDERDQQQTLNWEGLREEIQIGLDQASRGKDGPARHWGPRSPGSGTAEGPREQA